MSIPRPMVDERRCAIEGCDGPRRGHGMCSKHYTRWRRHGDPNFVQKVRRGGVCEVDGCNRQHYAFGWCRLHWERNHQHGSPDAVLRIRNGSLTERLEKWSTQVGACQEWTGRLSKDGYGQMRVDGRSVRAHRVAYEVQHGEIPEALVVRHKCDNRRCVLADHLELGTPADNSNDAVVRGRLAVGEKNGDARLTNVQAAGIYRRARAGESHAALANEFGVSKSTVGRISRGESWQSVTGAGRGE